MEPLKNEYSESGGHLNCFFFIPNILNPSINWHWLISAHLDIASSLNPLIAFKCHNVVWHKLLVKDFSHAYLGKHMSVWITHVWLKSKPFGALAEAAKCNWLALCSVWTAFQPILLDHLGQSLLFQLCLPHKFVMKIVWGGKRCLSAALKNDLSTLWPSVAYGFYSLYCQGQLWTSWRGEAVVNL